MARYESPKDGELITPIMRGYKMACCDCGLVHRVDFQVLKRGRSVGAGRWIATPVKGYRVGITVERDNRATAAVRREKKRREVR